MNFDDLLPFIIFVGYIGFAIVRGVLKKKKGQEAGKSIRKAEPKKVSGIFKLLKTIRTEFEQSLVQSRQKGDAADASFWETEDERPELEPDLESDKVMSQNFTEELVEDIEKPSVKEYVPEKKALKKSRPINIHTQGIQKREKKKYVTRLRRIKISPSKMREAIVMSEIIAKPVGLRD